MAGPGAREQVRIQILDRQRRRREIEVVAVNLLDDPSVEAVLVTGSDVTEGRHNQIARRLETRLLQRLPAAVVVTDDRGIVVYWNDRAATVFGYSASEAIGRLVTDLQVGAQSGDDAEVVERSL